MMIVDLIDGEDFRQRLTSLGVRIPEEACPETCARLAAGCHRARGVEGLEPALAMFAKRGVGRVLCQEHVAGEVIKFYGVGSERFWFWRSVAERRHLPYADTLSSLGREP